MAGAWQDIRFALRSLRKHPLITALAVLSLALGVAGNTTVFGLINGLLYRPLPFENPEQLVFVGEREQEGPPTPVDLVSEGNFLDWRERQTSFESLAGFRPVAKTRSDLDTPETLSAALVTPDFFSLLGTRPNLGRGLLPEEGAPGAAPTVVLSHRFWTQQLAADPQVLDQQLELDGQSFTIVGVLPEGFEFVDPKIELWAPLVLDRASATRSPRNLLAVGRLRTEVELATARSEMTTLAAAIEEAYPQENRGFVVQVQRLREQFPDANNRALLIMLQGALVLVLLIACANLAMLLVARGQAREQEIAIRRSLGAAELRITRQFLTESVTLASLGGLVGLLLAMGAIKVTATALSAALPSFYAPVLDVKVLLFSLGVTLIAGLALGVAPVLQVRSSSLASKLKDGSRSTSGGRRRRTLSKALVVLEFAAALVLMGGGSILIRSFLELQHRSPGFTTEGVSTVALSLPENRYGDDPTLVSNLETLVAELAQVPGVEVATVSNQTPRTPFVQSDALVVLSNPPRDGEAPPRVQWLSAAPAYLDTLGIPLLQGRFFEATDRLETESVVVVNKALADRYWPDTDPLGAMVDFQQERRRIVGVVGDVMHGLVISQDAQPTVYVPVAQKPSREVQLILRSEVGLAGLTEPVGATVRRFDPKLAIPQMLSLDDYVAQFFVGTAVFQQVLGLFGILALFLAAIGTYGLLAFAVAQRTQEIGVRIAMGAKRSQVIRMIARQGLTLAALGIALGVPGVLAVSKLIATALADLAPVEFGSLAVIALVLVVTTLLASWVPARRAAGVDPVEALRAD